MKKNPKIFIEHIQESIEEIERNTHKMTKKKFENNTTIQDAVIRRIEIIGEATKNIPHDFRKKNPQIEWKEMAGMRDKLIHDYSGVDLDLVWEVVKKEIPMLKKQILKLLDEFESRKRRLF